MWTKREQAVVFSLTLTMAWAAPFCDVTKLGPMDASALNGTLYTALVTQSDYADGLRLVGADVTPLHTNGEQYVTYNMYYTAENSPTCYDFQISCKVTNNACVYSSINSRFYVIAQDDNYVVLYTPRGNDLNTLEIYARHYSSNKPLQIGDVSLNIRNTIADVCGVQYTQPGAYPRQFPAENFIPSCQN